ncbi:MAG: LytTR family DNA-binding domain-containing protein [Candidatus Sulfotelmatobacter sp.]
MGAHDTPGPIGFQLPGSTPDTVVRTVIADDEHLARQKLVILLDAEPQEQIVAECQNGKETIAAIRALRPDLLVLDIQMPDLDVFQVLSEISSEQMPVVVFTSAYDEYAIRAFEAHALDYLLKPFDQRRLHDALERVRAEFWKARERKITQRILGLLAQVRSGTETQPATTGDDRIVIKVNGRVVFLDLDDIDWVEAAANYVQFNVGKESYLFRETISRVAERLDPKHFVRIHRSTIVNIRKIKELIPVNSGEYVVVLKGGKELSCSRGYRPALHEIVEKGL